MDEQKIAELRTEIDRLNVELLTILNKRAAVAQEIGKAKQGATVYKPGRESQVLEQVVTANDGPLSDESVKAIFREVIAACRNLERQLRVTYLGPIGTYSEEAARQFCGSTCEFSPCSTIDEALRAVEHDDADVAVLPIENSIEGVVNRTLDLLLGTSLRICGEVALPIHHQLLSQADALDGIKEVLAHPQALAQCRQWLAAHVPQATQTSVSSNAEAARVASASPFKAAIAGKTAAKVYNIATLAANIEDDASNTTRFIVLSKEAASQTGSDKTTLICSVPNQTGSLHKLLTVFAETGINMTSLESRPSSNGLWDYVFYITIDGHQDDAPIAAALAVLRTQVSFIKVVGSYPRND